jgi:alpha-D-ribose 1-methylphosphonate 5-triphosphate diphosphatase
MTETRFINARVVTPDAVIDAGLVVAEGQIVGIEPNLAKSAGAIDLRGDLLIPGLIDIHTDNLERHFEPRPGVRWDSLGAVLAHDSQMVGAGITTVFDSLSLHGHRKGFDRTAALSPMIASLNAAREENILRADHFLHLRCEVRDPELLRALETYLDDPLLKLLSLMDHSPGQRQYRNLGEEETRQHAIDIGNTGEDIETTIASWRQRIPDACTQDNWRAVVEIAHERGLPLATHDDEQVEHVHQAKRDGAVISEFPVTIEAAAEAVRQNLAVFMGAPNLIRGGSHSGNVSVAEVASAGYLHGLASDYVPMSLLRAAFRLTEAPFLMPLPVAIATVTATPARVTGLVDRGEIAVGKRADLVRVALSQDGWPVVRGVWHQGRRVG